MHRCLLLLPLLFATADAQTKAPPQSPFAALIAEYLHLDETGHSPTADDIAAMATLQPRPDAAAVADAIPTLLKCLDNSDVALHTFALSAISGLQATPEVLPATAVQATTANAYKADVAKRLAPIVPQLAAHLTEESQDDRLLTATVLGGFTPDPPQTVYPPLIAFLKRDDAIGGVGLAVVNDLLTLAPISDEIAATIATYIRRRDQTSDSRSNIVEAIATNAHQSQALNKTLLNYLDSDDDSLRARVILSLPQLDLALDVFKETQSRIAGLAENSSENLQVVNAAKAVTNCWTETKMTAGCPKY